MSTGLKRRFDFKDNEESDLILEEDIVALKVMITFSSLMTGWGCYC